LGTVARLAATGTDLSIGYMVFPHLCDHVIYILVFSEADG
jgi:hypothetical protein